MNHRNNTTLIEKEALLLKQIRSNVLKIIRDTDKLLDHNTEKNIALSLIFYKYLSSQNQNKIISIPNDITFESILAVNENELWSILIKNLNQIYKENDIISNLSSLIKFEIHHHQHITPYVKTWLTFIENHNNYFTINNWHKIFLLVHDIFIAEYESFNKVQFTITEPLSRLMSQLIIEKETCHKNIEIYDPCCRLGDLLSAFASNNNQNVTLYGQDLKNESVLLTKMNLILQGYNNFTILKGDAINNPQFTNGNKLKQFDHVITVPPFYVKTKIERNDEYERWNSKTGIPRERSPIFAFILNSLASIKDNGSISILVPNSVLNLNSRQPESQIIRYLVDNNFILGIIHLKPGILKHTFVATSIMILTKQPNNGDVFMVDATAKGCRIGNYTELSNDEIFEIENIWKSRKELENISFSISKEKIVQNDYSLQFGRYLVDRNIIPAKEGYEYLDSTNKCNSI